MSMFPETSITLLAQIAARTAGDDEAAWVRFFELYAPAIGKFVELQGTGRDPDDVVQEVLMKLVNVLREGRFKPGPVPFRAYLVTLIRRHLVSLWRKDQARGAGLFVPLEEDSVSVPSAVAELIDLDWRLAKRRAAVEHVLTKTAVSPQSKAVYRAYVLEERPIGEVAKEFGIPRNSVSQIKTRLDLCVRRASRGDATVALACGAGGRGRRRARSRAGRPRRPARRQAHARRGGRGSAYPGKPRGKRG